jgi:TolC family type I secretion outer membrane protein
MKSILSTFLAVYFVLGAAAFAEEKPVSLNDALIAAYKNNPDIAEAISNLEATNELSPQALSEWLPSASVDMDYGRQRSQFGSSPRKYSNVNSKVLNAEQPIFKGTLGANSDHAENLIYAQRAIFQQVEQQVLLDTITAYSNLVADNQNYGLAKKKVEVLSKQLEETEARFNVGELTKTDTSQATARLASAFAEQSAAESRLVASKAEFERLTGISAVAVEAPKVMPVLPESYDEALKQALKNNPKILASRYDEMAKENEVDLNIGELLPKVSVKGSASRQQDNSFSGSDFNEDSITLNLNIPLYQGGAEYSAVREAKKKLSAAKSALMAANNQVRQESRTSWQAIKVADTNINANQQAVKAAEVALEGVRAENEQGLRTIIDVLDAEQELYTTKTALEVAKRDRIIAYYTMLSKLGLLTAQNLGLKTDIYDADGALSQVKYKFIGF